MGKTKMEIRKQGSKAGWRSVGWRSVYFRSKWEANYGRYLQFLKEKDWIKDWQHEPQTFWFENIKRGVRSYLPDFKITRHDGTHYWVEVKGYMDPKSSTKIKRFNKYYKDEELQIIGKLWFATNATKLKLLIKEWES